MNKAFKFRIYPNNKQKILINRIFGCTRFVYNRMLADRIGHYENTHERLKKEQRKLSKCIKGSSNWNKQRMKVAKLHEKVTDQRKDFLHKLSKQTANAADAVCIEDLDIKGMSRSLNFGKSVHDNGFGKFVSMLEYKLNEQGKELIKVGKWFPSSKKCSNCGVVKVSMLLSERVYRCENCGFTVDRDLKASYNIRNEGMRLFQQKQINKTVGHTGIARLCCSS